MKFSRSLRLARQRRRTRGRSRGAIFGEVYSRSYWGDGDQGFFSGDGSSVANTSAYEAFVVDFVRSRGVRRVVDIGCGDFQVASRIIEQLDPGVEYCGVDVVPELVEHLQSRFSTHRISFACIDAVDEILPEGDLVLVREVLQHLSNADVQSVLSNIGRFDYALITNSVHRRAVDLNVDLPSGSMSRVGLLSGLVLSEPPFDVPTTTVLEIPHVDFESTLRTELLENS